MFPLVIMPGVGGVGGLLAIAVFCPCGVHAAASAEWLHIQSFRD